MMERQTQSSLPEGHIRLLSIHPNQDPPSGTLTVAALKDKPDFNALSYAWGDPGTTLEFSCSGAILCVHENLADFLRLASRKYHHRPIWIDAICINQDDDSEKNHQIPLMGEIYSNASQVLVWLGTNSEQGDEAFRSIPIIVDGLKYARSENSTTIFPQQNPYLGIPSCTSPVWLNIGQIFCRSWFHRLWVMQEVYQSSNVILLCGKEVVEWEKFVYFIAALYNRYLEITVFLDLVSGTEVGAGLDLTRSLVRLKSESASGMENESVKVFSLIHSIRGRHVTKPVDKVYGALAIMPPCIQRSLAVDVSLSAAHVYREFAKCLIQCGYATIILSHASHSIQGLPSWCPNFAERPLTLIMGYLRSKKSFRAGYELKESGKERIKMLQDDMIEAVGFEIDVILATHFSEALQSTLKNLPQWDEDCLEMAKRYYDSSEYDVMLQGLCEARTAGYRLNVDVQQDSPPHATTWMQDYECWKSVLSHNQGAEYHFSQPEFRFAISALSASRGRCFFITKGKSMGSGPAAAQVGDHVCILYGKPTPFILRRNSDQSTYRLIGEAYVNGVMDGEAFELRDKHSIPDQIFVIR
jgi:Heterokaryon incompatibility protein (HET)